MSNTHDAQLPPTQILPSSGSPKYVTDVPTPKQQHILRIPRHYTRERETLNDVLARVEWTLRDVEIADYTTKKPVFSQKNVRAPASWSDDAVRIVAAKYFRGHVADGSRETGVDVLVYRVVGAISRAAKSQGYFTSVEELHAFEAELGYILLHQVAAFNSPVWFNVGVSEHPQSSACFINTVEDSMESILDLVRTEARLFKGGSGSGVNMSSLRARDAKLSGTGKASGPVSFMAAADAFAGVIKSGGKTRRAAKMVILNADHPDIIEFIDCKVGEEEKARALIAQGYPADFNGPAYTSLRFQNANHSVRAGDAFMTAATEDVRSAEDTTHPGHILDKIAAAAHACGDPGMQFDDTINAMNPVLSRERINASNPCSEYMFVDDSACNLASINLMKFRTPGVGVGFDLDAFVHVVDVLIHAMDVLVDASSYPTAKIAQNSHAYRPLGLGYANLGALLMSLGLAYDSREGRNVAASITALMGGRAYVRSAELARAVAPFRHYDQPDFLRVIRAHRQSAEDLVLISHQNLLAEAAAANAATAWEEAEAATDVGFRNAQVTVLAPTGTIAFMMDCDTTGIEPEIALRRMKNLAGGGHMLLVNRGVESALTALDYSAEKIEELLRPLVRGDVAAFRAGLADEDQAVFDTSFADATGRSIAWTGHVDMMAAVQPFLSGAISKTVNMPAEATVEDVREVYVRAWQAGLKAVAVYRDGSKGAQVLSTVKKDDDVVLDVAPASPPATPTRMRLPDTRDAVTHKFSVGGHEGYVNLGFYADGRPGEMFLTVSKAGSTLSGAFDALATAFSIMLQHGIPLSTIVDKFQHSRFPPAGMTQNPELRIASSILDYVVRWTAQEVAARAGGAGDVLAHAPTDVDLVTSSTPSDAADLCSTCGTIMVRTGACQTCPSCGQSGGCG